MSDKKENPACIRVQIDTPFVPGGPFGDMWPQVCLAHAMPSFSIEKGGVTAILTDEMFKEISKDKRFKVKEIK